MTEVSILITTFQRPHLLKWNLFSLAKQNIPFTFETIILNDGTEDATRKLCQEYKTRLNTRYIFTGQRNTGGQIKYRVPGFALNVGIKKASGKVLVVSCAEMFHINNTIELLCKTALLNKKNIATCIGMDDDGTFLEYINVHNGDFDLNAYNNNYRSLNTRIPFLMAYSREELIDIGGYDEGFTGLAYDDNDIMDRLINNGCNLLYTEAKTIHLYHQRHDTGLELTPEYLFNAQLYYERQGQIVRNIGSDWGRIEDKFIPGNTNIRIKVKKQNISPKRG